MGQHARVPDEPRLRQVFPELVDPADLPAAYARRDRGDGRPCVRVNMIASVDGATTVQGLSGALGGPGDRAVFAVLRSLADVVFVGAGTVRSEGYRPVRLGDAARARRAELGLSPVPPIAVVTASANLDWDAPFFTEAVARPIVVTAERGARSARDRAGAVAEIVVAGDEQVDPARAVEALGELGFRHVLAEGGPHLNGQLAEAGLVDELCLTLSPSLVGGASGRILTGPDLTPPVALELAHVLEGDGLLFLRFTRA
jgi:riboflavin biosynthesis pyrimidine reductase